MRRLSVGLLLMVIMGFAVGFACQPPELGPLPEATTEVHTDLTYLKDGYGRYLNVHGVNLGGSTKTPFTWPWGPEPNQVDFQGLDFSYIDRPFPVEEADHWFGQMNDLGFSTIRLMVVWEAIEPDEKGVYNEEYLDYIEQIVAKAEEHGIYVLMDMHQDMFSRHLMTRMNEHPYETLADAGVEDVDVIAASVTTLVTPYSDTMRGDGAPRWAVEAALPHKNMDSIHWGDPSLLGNLDLDAINALVDLIEQFTGSEGGSEELPDWAGYFIQNLPSSPYGIEETTNLLPWSFWGLNNATSMDLEQCWASFFAGADVYPGYTIEGQNVQDYLQEAYANSWRQVAMRVKGHDNVIGYDLMNEPNSIFLVLAAGALLLQTGLSDSISPMLIDLLGEEMGQQMNDILLGLQLIPMDTEEETIRNWGFEQADLMAIIGLNIGFDHNYLEPFYSRVGQAIQEEDPGAVIWIEQTAGLNVVVGGGMNGQMEVNLRAPEGIDQLVYAPHWYPDIYPMVGLVREPRDFTVEEIRHRDYTAQIDEVAARAWYSLGNVPVVFGEFGTYYNYNGIEQSIEEDYRVSAEILDNYYEAFEESFTGGIQWVFTTDNSYEEGDWWNGEDFSVIDPYGEPRGELAYSRPYARAMAGKPVRTHFLSPVHYYDPAKGTPDQVGEFYVEYESRETDAPTEIFVPEVVQYKDGFYVWLSDGRAYYDPGTHILYHYPANDAPGQNHWVKLLPPRGDQAQTDWDYFFHGEEMVNGR